MLLFRVVDWDVFWWTFYRWWIWRCGWWTHLPCIMLFAFPPNGGVSTQIPLMIGLNTWVANRISTYGIAVVPMMSSRWRRWCIPPQGMIIVVFKALYCFLLFSMMVHGATSCTALSASSKMIVLTMANTFKDNWLMNSWCWGNGIMWLCRPWWSMWLGWVIGWWGGTRWWAGWWIGNA